MSSTLNMSRALEQASRQNVQVFHKGEIILFPGKSVSLFRLRQGLVRIHTVDDEGNGLTLRYVKPRGFFGEESIFSGSRSYFAEAVTEVEVEVLQPEMLTTEQHESLTQYLAEAMAVMYRALFRLSGKRLKSRIAAELLELRDSALSSLSDNGAVLIHLTHDDLAAAVGSVRETVTKVVGELVREGAIEARYGKVVLVNERLLQDVAGE